MRYKGNINLDGVTSLKDDFQDITILKVSDVKGAKNKSSFLHKFAENSVTPTIYIYVCVC